MALDGGGEQIACFTLSWPGQAADPEFLQLVRRELRLQQRQPWQHATEAAGSHGDWGRSISARPASGSSSEEAELDHLMSLMLGGGASSGGGSSVGGSGSGSVSRPAAAATAAARAPPPLPVLPGAGASSFSAALAPAAAAEADWQLAAELQGEEDAALAAAEAAREEAACEQAMEAAHADWRLAREWQEREDAAVAEALAAQEEAEQAAAAGRATAASSSSYWSRLRLDASGDASPLAARGRTSSSAGGGGGSRSSTRSADPFPSLQAAGAAADACASGSSSEATRRLLHAQHRSAKQLQAERGSGIRLLSRGVGRPRSLASAPGSPSWQGGAGPAGVGSLPPLQLDEGLRLHEDDLGYQLLLKVRAAWWVAIKRAHHPARWSILLCWQAPVQRGWLAPWACAEKPARPEHLATCPTCLLSPHMLARRMMA